MLDRARDFCRDAGWICFGAAGGADVAANHVVSTLTIAGLVAGILFHVVGAVCTAVKTRSELRRSSAPKALRPWPGPNYDQLEGRN